MPDDCPEFSPRMRQVLGGLADPPPGTGTTEGEAPQVRLSIRKALADWLAPVAPEPLAPSAPSRRAIPWDEVIHHAAEAALTADFTPAGKAPEDYRLIAQTILDSYLMTGPTQLPARKDLYLEVAEAVLQRSIHLTQARLEARQLPAIEVTTGGLAEDTGEGTVNKALGETLDAGVRAFWHHADQLRDLRERNRPGYEDPFLLRWFAGRTVLEIVLLLELPQSSVEGRIAYIETETGFPSAPKTPQAIGAT